MPESTMCHEQFGRTMLCIHGPGPVVAAQWSAYANACRSDEYDGILVIADPGSPGPDAVQRAEVMASFKTRTKSPHIAVVTESAIHRGIVTVMSWIQRNTMVAYPPTSIREAMNFARVSPSSQGELITRLHQIAGTVNSTWLPRAVRLQPTREATL